MEHMDIFNDDAFSLVSLTAAINDVDHVPGRVGALAFQGVGRGVATTTVSIEKRGVSLSLIQTSVRGAPAPKETRNGSTLRSVNIPHIKLEDTIQASEVAGVREFGSTDTLESVTSAINQQLGKMALRHDLTLENHRLGAIQGQILDADSTVLTDLFTLFGVQNSDSNFEREVFNFALDDASSDDIRVVAQRVVRYINRKAKAPMNGARYWALCGDEFFDKLISREDVKAAYENQSEQTIRLGGNFAFGIFEFAGIIWENYRGTDDGEGDSEGGTVGIVQDECNIFPVGVPGLYEEYFAPATFIETVNTRGLPRYAKMAPDKRFNESVEVHTQQNPLPLCLRPQVLVRGVSISN